VNGKPLAGEQMVDVLRVVGVDYIIFGNHEFDYDERTFHDRLAELVHLRDLPDFGPALDRAAVKQANDRRRALFSTNVTRLDGLPFVGVPTDRIWEPYDEQGNRLARIGFVGLTIETRKSDPKKQYAMFKPRIEAAAAQIIRWEQAGQKLNAVLALTHQS